MLLLLCSPLDNHGVDLAKFCSIEHEHSSGRAHHQIAVCLLISCLSHRPSPGERPVPAVRLGDLQQFQKWGPQKAPLDIGRFFSFGKRKYPEIVQESEDPLVLREVRALARIERGKSACSHTLLDM